jgi:hypothetical protein
MIYRRGSSNIFYLDFMVKGKRYYRSTRTTDRTEARIAEMKAKIQALEESISVALASNSKQI